MILYAAYVIIAYLFAWSYMRGKETTLKNCAKGFVFAVLWPLFLVAGWVRRWKELT